MKLHLDDPRLAELACERLVEISEVAAAFEAAEGVLSRHTTDSAFATSPNGRSSPEAPSTAKARPSGRPSRTLVWPGLTGVSTLGFTVDRSDSVAPSRSMRHCGSR